MKHTLLTSKLWAAIYLLIVIIFIVVTFKMRQAWWCYFDIFFAFMAMFCHLMATIFQKLIPAEARRLDKIALGMIVATIISLIAEIIAFYTL